MMKLLPNKPAAALLWLSAVILYFYPAESTASAVQKPDSQSPAKSAAEDSTIVGRIAYYNITRKELEERLMVELHPYDYEYYDVEAEPPDAQSVLMKMLAEKAMIIEARAQGYLDREDIRTSVKRFKERRLVNLLLQKHVEGKVTVTDAEIKLSIQADPKLDEAQAKALIERTKTNRILDRYYNQIYGKSNVRKLTQNFPIVIQVHDRLLRNPKQPRKASWIQTSQIREELTQTEKDLVLAEYKTGRITLKDWFESLCEIVPPRRPRDLNTPQGVNSLLERALRMPLLVAEAESLGLDKDQEMIKQVRDYEDRRLLSEARGAKNKEVTEPTTDQIIAYFGKNKKAFGTSDSLKIDLIWLADLKTAKLARAALDSGKDFEAVRKQYSPEKEGKPFNTHPGSEGLFWKDLWAGDPNQIIGPVKGFYQQGISWRIVKILEKTPGLEKPYSSDMESRVKSRLKSELSKALIEKYGKELLKKYPYQIYADRIKDIDPLNIP